MSSVVLQVDGRRVAYGGKTEPSLDALVRPAGEVLVEVGGIGAREGTTAQSRPSRN